MVKNLAPISLLLLLAAGCSTETPCTKGSEFEPSLCPSAYTKVSNPRIELNAATHPANNEPQTNCEKFLLTEDVVKQFFELAKVTTDNNAHHTLDWSPCFARGEIELTSGERAVWEISQSRVGKLSFSDGEAVTLYCADCKFPPFH